MSKVVLGLFLVSFLSVPLHVQASESPWVSAEQLRARLVASQSQAALEIELKEGWHSYWRVPGEAGLPPRFDWSQSVNVSSVDVHWPAPHRMDEAGFVTFGYQGNYSFPLTVYKTDTNAVAKLDLVLDIMVCKEICIPQQLKLAMDMDGAASDHISAIEAALLKVPKTDGPITIATVVNGPDSVVITATSKNNFSDIDAFVTVGETAFTAKPVIKLNEKDPHQAMVSIAKSASVLDLTDKDISVVLVSGDDSAEKIVKF